MTVLPQHSKISFTAKLVALARSQTDIPFAGEIARLIDAASIAQDTLGQNTHASDDTYAWMAPMVEARYKSLASALRRCGIKQVLEFASGISLRGLSMTLSDPDLTYIETDLPDLTAEKKLLVQELLRSKNLALPVNHHIVAANILHWDEIEKALTLLDPCKPIAVIHEGLLMYLSHGEKEAAARHIHRILARFGGVWITPDFAPINPQSWKQTAIQGLSTVMEAIEKQTGRSFTQLSFADDDQIDAFCQRLGFTYTTHPQLDGSYAMSTSTKARSSDAELALWQNNLKLWELRPLA